MQMYDQDDLVRALKELVVTTKGIERELKTANYIRMCEIKAKTEKEETDEHDQGV